MGDALLPDDLAQTVLVKPAFEVEDALKKLSSKEKIELLAGIDFWHTKAVPRLNIPSIRCSDGPNGVRGTRFFNGSPAACFPCGTALASTWNTELLERAGELMGEEARAKGAHLLLGPTVNIQRSPLGGRGFESFSEDPVLAGNAAASVVKGIQSTGVQASIKHFVANDQEHERMAVDSLVTQRALREIYLMPFQIAARDAKPKSFMTAYNKLNGTHVSEDPNIIRKILREEWRWEGLIISDWYGTYSTAEAINAGLDLEMPGPTRWRGQLLNHAIMSKKVTQETVDERVRHVLRFVHDAVKTGIPCGMPEGTRNTPQTAALLREIAGESIVLLKNEHEILPFKKNKTVAVIGPNAKTSVYCGGGSATLLPYYAVTPYEGLAAKARDLRYAIGCHAHKMLPMLGPRLKASDGRVGVDFRAFTSPDTVTDRKPVDSLHLVDTDMYFADYYHPELTEDLWWGEIEAVFEAEETCAFEFGLCVFGTGRLYIDDELLIDNETEQRSGGSFFNVGTVEETGVKHVVAGHSYRLKVVFASGAASKIKDADGVVSFGGGGVRIGGTRVVDIDEEIARAVKLAQEVDQVVICVGLNSDFEQEGHDRPHMDLPGRSDELISAVAAANSRTVVVVQSGTPVTMPWAGAVSGILQAWYGGNETGNAIADTLFGDVNPSAKLSLSFPVCVRDNPAYLNYRSERGRVLYGEDIYVGYRYYEAIGRRVLWSFGWGLSYTTFEFSDLEITVTSHGGADMINVSTTIENTGDRDGSEVVQVYVSQRTPSINRPPKELKGFTKLAVPRRSSRVARVQIVQKYATSFWDEQQNKWVEEAGIYDVSVGNSSVYTPLKGTFEVHESSVWSGL